MRQRMWKNSAGVPWDSEAGNEGCRECRHDGATVDIGIITELNGWITVIFLGKYD